MPRISEFFGLAIYMYWNDTQKHHQPHFHVRYAGDEWVYELDGMLLAGSQNSKIDRLVKDWCHLNQKELVEAWKMAISGKELPWIRPLV